VTRHLRAYDLGLAAQTLYDFVWSEYCDWYVELAKGALYGEDETAKAQTRAVLLTVLDGILKMLHPFMPFVTEKLYGLFPDPSGMDKDGKGMLILAPWPNADAALRFPDDETQMEGLMDIVRQIRAARAERAVAPGKRAKVYALPQPGWEAALQASEGVLRRLASASDVAVLASRDEAPEHAVQLVSEAAAVWIPLGELIDVPKETQRVKKELAALDAEVARAKAKLENPGFLAKAPQALVEEERAKLAAREAMRPALAQQLAQLTGLGG